MIEDGIARMMQEYATMAVLAIHRGLPRHSPNSRRGDSAPVRVKRPASAVWVSILGLGVLEVGVIERAALVWLPPAGWSRTTKVIDGRLLRRR